MWEITSRGFLPENNPVHSLEFEPEFQDIEYLTSNIPEFLEKKEFRKNAISILNDVGLFCCKNEFPIEVTEKLFKHYCYIASSYVHAPYVKHISVLPKEISIPLVHLANKVSRHPILSYSCYALNNWRLIDPELEIKLGNIELQQNFSLSHKKDEDWFILVHVDIENSAAKAISVLNDYRKDAFIPPLEVLKSVHDSLINMNQTMNRMPENCSEDFYFKAVRPFIFSFENIVYDGCFENKPQTFRGETGAQSAIVPSLIAALGIKHGDTMLTKHLEVMREYMPIQHRKFISDLETMRDNNLSLRHWVVKQSSGEELYNHCLEELLKFRTKHLEFAINYIQKKVENPTGTGGTPFIPWLTQLRDETDEYFLR